MFWCYSKCSPLSSNSISSMINIIQISSLFLLSPLLIPESPTPYSLIIPLHSTIPHPLLFFCNISILHPISLPILSSSPVPHSPLPSSFSFCHDLWSIHWDRAPVSLAVFCALLLQTAHNADAPYAPTIYTCSLSIHMLII